MSQLPPDLVALIDQYADGPNVLRQALSDFPADKLATPLPPGQWSALQVVGHLADSELLYADRIQAIVAEDGPQMPARDESRFVARLRYESVNVAEELDLIAAVRRHVSRLLRALTPAEFQRVGIHSVAGPLTLSEVLTRATGHLPHHAEFIARKREKL